MEDRFFNLLLETRDAALLASKDAKEAKEAIALHIRDTEDTPKDRRRVRGDTVGKVAQWAGVAVAIVIGLFKR